MSTQLDRYRFKIGDSVVVKGWPPGAAHDRHRHIGPKRVNAEGEAEPVSARLADNRLGRFDFFTAAPPYPSSNPHRRPI